jgi:hypothetical protein
VITRQELEDNLKAAVAELKEADTKFKQLSTLYAVSDQNYRHAKAIAYLKSDGTVQARQAQVDIACEKERESAHSSEALREAAKEHLKCVQVEISVYQTLAGLMKAEMAFEGRYEP